ncbi:hypothetical protein ZWY2020_059507 [Hordeum vulgare]|nr:hypothetical protein ZWY2020_059507 [Hordeum vulgare]
MELATRDLAALGAGDLVRASAAIPRAAPRTFALLTACLVFPLSFAVLAHSLFTHPILRRIRTSDYTATSAQWVALFAYQFLYLIFLFTFSLLSTAAAVFTVASLYAAKPASISSSLSALPPILPRLLRTFLWVSLLMLAYHVGFVLTVVLLIVLFGPPVTASTPPPLSLLLALLAVAFLFLAIHVYISAPGTSPASSPCSSRYAASPPCPRAGSSFRAAPARPPSSFSPTSPSAVSSRLSSVQLSSRGKAREPRHELGGRMLIGALLVSVLVCVNLLGLLVQSVFYYAARPTTTSRSTGPRSTSTSGLPWRVRAAQSNIQMENL